MGQSINNKVIAISLFTGAGGIDVGCEQVGVPVVSCVETDDDCIQTLKLNRYFKNANIYHKDAREISCREMKSDLKKKRHSKFIIIGGPPCQPFSKAGYWIGHKARKIDKDPRNVIGEFLRIISEMKPHGFLFENVESLMHPTNKHIVEEIESVIRDLKYKHKIIRACALDYGVPQKRKRIFIIASRKNFKTQEPVKTHCHPDDCSKTGLVPYENVGKFIAKFANRKYFEKEEVTKYGTYGEELRKVPPGKNYIALTAKLNYPNPKFIAGKRFWSFLLKLHPDRPSWTIAAQPGPWVGPFHWTSRRLRVPEIAAIQRFPEDYVFYGSRRSIQKQIGNAVPPKMAKAFVEFLLENL